MFRLVVCAIVLGAACKGDPPKSETKPAPVVAQPAPDPCKKAEAEGPLRWIADDYPAALACAKQREVPVVIDLWAPWCHTCLSMQTTVMLDPSFAADDPKFVFLKLDTDRDVNAAPLEKLSISAWPTFYVIDSGNEAVLARYVGAASLPQFHAFLDAGLAHDNPHVLAAQRALASKDFATAETELTTALAAATVATKPELLNTLILTKHKRGDFAGCVELAEKNLDQIGTSSLASDFLVSATTCADELKDPAAQKQMRSDAVKTWQKILAESKDLSVDDRSDAMASLRETLDKLGDKATAVKTAEAQRALLDDAAAKAATPLAAMTYNWPRAEVYVYLGVPLELVPALEKSAQDLPKEYDPRARLGWIYLQAKDYANAAKWLDEALALVYGPRKGRLLIQRADVAAAQRDTASERRFREQAVKLYEGLPKGQEAPEALAKAKEALAKLTSAQK